MKTRLIKLASVVLFLCVIGCTEDPIEGPRDAASGLATGKTADVISPRDPASGQATGK